MPKEFVCMLRSTAFRDSVRPPFGIDHYVEHVLLIMEGSGT
jgi:hypothetical protein